MSTRCCDHAPMPWSGAYGHWRCQRRRFHLGRHRFNNYTIRRGARLYGGFSYGVASAVLAAKKWLRLTEPWRVVLRRTNTRYDPERR